MNMPNNIVPEFIIFLDFDGVLHPADASEHEKFRPAAIWSVNRILDKLDANIVLSTAWRMDYSTDKFNAWFKNRIIDSTPVHDLDLKKENLRFHEVMDFLKTRGWLHIPWLAVDDKRLHYPDGSPAYITDHKIGLTQKDTDHIILIGQPTHTAPVPAPYRHNHWPEQDSPDPFPDSYIKF